MRHTFTYTYDSPTNSDWAVEGSNWRPPAPDFPLTLRDDAGALIGSSTMTTMLLTLYDLETSAHAIVNAVDHVDIKNTRSCTISSQGIFTFALLPLDTAILINTRPYEKRRALIEFTWASGAKSAAIEITFIVKNMFRRPV